MLLSIGGAFAQSEGTERAERFAQRLANQSGSLNSSDVDAPTDGLVRYPSSSQIRNEVSVSVNPNFQIRPKAMRKSEVQSDKIFGDRITPNPYGIQKIGPDGGNVPVLTTGKDVQYKCFGIKDNRMYAFVWSIAESGIMYTASFRVINLETLEVESDTNLRNNDFNTTFIQKGCFIPEEMTFYGFTADGWVKYNVTTGRFQMLAKEAESTMNCRQMTYNSNTKTIVGVNLQGEFYSFDKQTSESKKLFETGIPMPEVSGLCYDAASDNYIWAPYDGSTSQLISINPITGETRKMADMVDNAHILSMYCTETAVVVTDNEGPAEAELISSNFPNGQHEGMVTYRLPSETCGGEALTGSLTYKLEINGNKYKSGTALAGNEISIVISDMANLKDGEAVFALTCQNGEHKGATLVSEIYVGNDVPLAPANVQLTPAQVSWDAVTAGVHSGYLDLSKMRYNVEINGQVVAEGISETHCATNLPVNAEMSEYTATVYAVCNGMVSRAGSSNPVMFGEAYSLPLNILPTPEQVEEIKIIDANSDAKTWTYFKSQNAYRYVYHRQNPADDWLILPAFKISDTEDYVKFTLEAWTVNKFNPETIEVFAGTAPTPEAMTIPVIGPTTVQSPTHTTYEGLFTCPDAGKYYIGIHCTSAKNKYFLYVNNFTVSQIDVEPAGPAAVNNVEATAGEKGALNATVKFTLPTTTNEGQTITGEITALVSDNVDEKMIKGAPGSEHTVVIETEQGDNQIDIQAFVGTAKGMDTTVSVYTGFDVPDIVKNLAVRMNADNVSGTLTWEAPAKGANGHYFVPTGIDYYLCQKSSQGWVVTGKIGTDVYDFKFNVQDIMAQTSMQLGVLTVNSAGQAPYITSVNFSVGQPYEVPAVETFPMSGQDVTCTYLPLLGSSLGASSVGWTLFDSSRFGGDLVAPGKTILLGQCNNESYGCATLPKFSTMNMDKVAFIPSFYVGGCKNLKITAKSYDVEETEIMDFSYLYGVEASGYTSFIVELPEAFQNQEWVEIRLYPYFDRQHPRFMLNEYKFKNMVLHDLGVSLQGTVKGYVNEKAEFEAVITNYGTSATQYSGGKFTVKNSEGDVVAEQTVPADELILSDYNTVVKFDYTPDVSDLGELTVSFSLLAYDQYNYNNTASMNCEVNKGKAVVVSNLTGKAETDGVRLSWTEPSIQGGYESFEDYTPFELSGDEIGAFTHVRQNGVSTYCWSGTAELQQLLGNVAFKSGFNVYDADQLDAAFGYSGIYPAASGHQFLLAFCPQLSGQSDGVKANDWLISPKVQPGSGFSFAARPVTCEFGKEILKLWYATEDTEDPAKFTPLETVAVGDVDNNASPVWETVEAQLPDNAVRFAIQYASFDTFGVMLDDINYIPEGGTLHITAYQVFRAQGDASEYTKISEVETPGYTDATVKSAIKNSYYVIPVISDGSLGLQSNVVVVETSGLTQTDRGQAIYGLTGEIILLGFDGQEVSVITTDGKTMVRTVAEGRTSIPVAAGVYIVKTATGVAKVVVP